MKHLAIVLAIFALPAAGASVSGFSPNPCDITAVRLGERGNPGCTVTVTGTDAWDITTDGNYYPEIRACVWLAADATHTSRCGSTAGGTGAATLRVYMEWDSGTIAAGDYSRSIAIAGTTIPVTVHVLPNPAAPVYFNAKRIADSALGCTAQDAGLDALPYHNLCSAPNQRPGGTYTIPAPGQTYTDPVFGTRISVVTNDHHDYSAVRIWSMDSRYVSINKNGQAPYAGIFDTRTLTRVANTPYQQGGGSDCQFSPVGYDLYCASGATIQKWTMGSHLPTLDGPVTVWTAPDGLTLDVGSAQINDDGVMLAYNRDPYTCTDLSYGSCHMIYVVNVFTGQYASFDAATLVPPSLTWRASRITEKDRVTGHHYVLVNDTTSQYHQPDPTGGSRILDYDPVANTLTYRTIMFDSGNWSTGRAVQDCPTDYMGCYGGGHQAEGVIGGRVYTAGQSSRGGWLGINMWFPGIAKDDLGLPREAGGGNAGYTGVMDHHTSAGTLPLLVGAFEFDGDPPLSAHIQTISGGSPATITLNDNDGGTTVTSIGVSPGGKVLIGCENGNGGTQDIEGTWTVGSTGASSITLTDLNYTGSYNQACAVAPDVALGYDGKAEVQAIRFDDLGSPMQVWRAAEPLSVGYAIGLNSGSSGYWEQAHTQISRDGRYIGWTTNGGQINHNRFVIAETPWQIRALHEYELAPGWPVRMQVVGANVQISASVPDSNDLTCSFSSRRDLASPATVTLSGPASFRQAIFSGSASTHYYWRCKTADGWYVAQSRLQTLPAASGNVTVRFSATAPPNTSTVGLQYGATASLGSSVAPAACPAGDQCTVTVTATHAEIYGSLTFYDAGGTILRQTAVQRILP